MRRTIQIGNLGYSIDNPDLGRLFAPYGTVHSATVSTHSSTGKSTGVGFVEMETGHEGESAIAALNDHEHDGRILTVCWRNQNVDPDVAGDLMFGPMNVAEVIVTPEAQPERRGLP